jgi:hypothetical protein
MKRLTILSTAIILSASLAFAERSSFRDHSENWLNNSNNNESTSGSLRGGGYNGGDRPSITDDDNTVTNPDAPGSIGGGIACLVLLASGYGLTRKK